MKPISLTLNQHQINTLKQSTKHLGFRTDIAHTLFQVKGERITITAYTSNKVVFSGEDAFFYASPFMPTAKKAMAGSDEVGTGDYFGPVTVCACLVREDDYAAIPVETLIDSKQLTDSKVMEIAPLLIEKLYHSLLILDNRKYNRIHQQMNLNAIKAKMHNQAYINLNKKIELTVPCIIDQFTPAKNYYNSLINEPAIFDKLHFETKAENKYLAVAAAAIIARFGFLDYLNKLSEKYDFQFPKGASATVDRQGSEFVRRFGQAELNNVAKTHFANTAKILQLLEIK